MNNNNITSTPNPQEIKKPNDSISSLETGLSELLSKNPKKLQELLDKNYAAFNEKYPKLPLPTSAKIEDYFSSFETVDNWINNCFDDIRNYVKVISYPLYVHLFIDMMLKRLYNESKKFLNKFRHKFPAFENEINSFELLKDPFNKNNSIITNYIENKIHLYIPKTYYQFFFHFLSTNNLILVYNIINKHFESSIHLSKITQFDSAKNDYFFLMNETGENLEKICNMGVYYEKLKQDLDLTIKSKGKTKTEKAILSKVMIPMPEQ